jgi:hypothetical protein
VTHDDRDHRALPVPPLADGSRLMLGQRPSADIQKERPAGEPGAKFAGIHGNQPLGDNRGTATGEQSTKYRATVPAFERGTVRNSSARKSSSEKAQTTSALPPLTTQDLTKACQSVVLQFRTTDVVEDSQASLRAIENIRNGESGMSLKTFVNLCRANVRVRAMVGPLLGYGIESDPDVVQAISILMNKLAREGDAHEHDAAEVCDEPMTDLFGGGA